MRVKRLIAAFTSFIFVLSTFMFGKINVKAADSPAISYSISQSSISPGDTFDITVNCANVSDLYGAAIDFKYDTSLIQVTGIDKGSVFSSTSVNYATPTNDTTNGLISFYEMLTGDVAGSNVTTASSLFVIHAKALKTGTINLNTTDNTASLTDTGFNVCVKLSDSSANKISYAAVGQTINIINNPITITSLTSDLVSPQTANKTITFTATANGGVAPLLYQFWVKDTSGWNMVQDYSTKNTFAWTPTANGQYKMSVYIKSTGSTNAVDASKTVDFNIADSVSVTALTSDLASPQQANKAITFTATATGGVAPLLYQFWVMDSSGWKMTRDYSSSNTFVWTPSINGQYKISVYVKSTGSTKSVDALKTIDFNIADPTPVSITSLTSDIASPQQTNKAITFTATATGGVAPLLYQFWVMDSSGWKMIRDYSSSNTFVWTPSTNGQYKISVYVKSTGSTKSVDAFKTIDFNIADPTPVSITSLISDLASPQQANKTITFTATATGGVAPLLYQFWVKDTSGWNMVQDYSTKNTFAWTPTANGQYKMSVYIKSTGSTNAVDASKTVDFNIADSVSVTALTSDLASPQQANKAITFTATATGGVAPLLYQFWVMDSSGWKMIRDYSSSNTFVWTPSTNGQYKISVYVKSTGSTKSVDAFKTIDFNIADPTPVSITSLTSDLASPQQPNKTITFTATATGGVAPLLYQFWVMDSSGWKMIRDYSSSNTFAWAPSENGQYKISAYVKSTGSTKSVDAFKTIDFNIADPVSVIALTSDLASPQQANRPITFTATATGGVAPLLYQFWVKDASGWKIIRDYSSSNTFAWTPSTSGQYIISVYVKSTGSSSAVEAYKTTVFNIIN